MYLQNVIPADCKVHQNVALALAMCCAFALREEPKWRFRDEN